MIQAAIQHKGGQTIHVPKKGDLRVITNNRDVTLVSQPAKSLTGNVREATLGAATLSAPPGAFGSDEEFAPMMLDATASRVTEGGVGPVGNFSKTSPKLSGVTRRYPYALELFPGRIVLFSPKPSSNQ